MPIVRLEGIPTDTPNLAKFLGEVQQIIAGIPELNLQREQVTVLPTDDSSGSEEKLAVTVDESLEQSQLAPAVLQQLARDLCTCVARFARTELPQCRRVKVDIKGPDGQARASAEETIEPPLM